MGMDGALSIIIPAYNEQDLIKTAYKAVTEVVEPLNIKHEIIFVDDGSKDRTFEIIEEMAADPDCSDLRGISFSRNFGKEAAIFAGLKEAEGDCCIVMDCDLQHPPAVIPEMIRLWQEGYEVVEGVKSSRGHENVFHKAMANLFYKLICGLSNIDLKDASDFMLLDRSAVDSLLEMPERAPFFRGLSRWIGFRSVKVPFEVADRQSGSSKWSIGSLAKYAITNMINFSSKPLQLVTAMGLIFIIASLFIGGEALFTYFTGRALGGFTTVITLILLSSGIIMLSLGIIGVYIARIYDEIKARPRYIIKKRCR